MSKGPFDHKDFDELPNAVLEHIIIGSSARGESYDNRSVEIIDISYNEGKYFIIEGDKETKPDDYEEYEVILDAFTTNAAKSNILLQLKIELINKYKLKIIKRLRNKINCSIQAIQNGFEYNFKGSSYPQHTITEFFINGDDQRSVKYTYLRTFQYLLLFILLKHTSIFSLYSSEQPTIENKINYLFIDGKLNSVEALRINDVYKSLINIYYHGLLKAQNEDGSIGEYQYTYPRSEEILEEANKVLEMLLDRFFTN